MSAQESIQAGDRAEHRRERDSIAAMVPPVPTSKAGTPVLTVFKFIGGLVPWFVIAALLFAAFFIQPQPVGETVQPPPLERRDRFNGLELLQGGERLWAVGSYGKIVRSDDAGASWAVQPVPLHEHLQDIAVWDEQRAVAVGNDGVVLVTADGGRQWEPVQAPRSDVFNKLVEVIARPDGTALAVGGFGAVLVSRDYGRSWQRAAEERDIGWNGIAVGPGGRIWVVGEFGESMSSVDGGASWQPFDPIVESSLMRVAFRPDRPEGVIVGLEGLLLVTVDGGEHWEKVDAGIDTHLLDVAWIGDRWAAVGNDGVIAYSAPDDLRRWTAQRIGPNERSWHTDLAPAEGALYLAGGSFGRLDRSSAQWVTFGGGAGDSKRD